MRSPVELGGCIALSTWLPLKHEYPTARSPANKNVNIFQVHGTADSVVSFSWGKSSHELLKTFCGVPPEFMHIEGMGHSSHPREIEAVNHFLKTILL